MIIENFWICGKYLNKVTTLPPIIKNIYKTMLNLWSDVYIFYRTSEVLSRTFTFYFIEHMNPIKKASPEVYLLIGVNFMITVFQNKTIEKKNHKQQTKKNRPKQKFSINKTFITRNHKNILIASH
jgi:hypothetical protein